ncbi:hypothetical protein [Sphingomonas sp.]|uniref:GAP1-N1 domain-containing protein n=1 Tax=Sphingomonas sp. TaxID=28214 RepID=UPI0028AB19C1|nr:hypothetical protein [Sphingomonas sp.]
MVAEAAPHRGRSSLRIDQTVHGYDRGHRLLAASRALDEPADQLLGSMSDLLTTGLLDGDSSYLVGYPLKAQNAYVLARTWPATEMPRPGSVWTHSLIIDYQTLAMLEDPSRLLALLRRPDKRTIGSFSGPITAIPESCAAPRQLTIGAARAAIASLYARRPARPAILPATTPADDEQLLLALWRQMWPALRRDTAFFSFTDEAPPAVDASCIIFFTGPQHIFATSDEVDGKAADLLLMDLPHPALTPIRSFLARHAFDAPEPRAAVLPLVQLWQAMTGPDRGSIVSALVNALPYANATRLAQSVLGQLFEGGFDGSPLLQVVEQFGDLKITMRAGWLTQPISWEAPADLGVLLDRSSPYAEGTLGAAIFESLAETTAIEDLAQANFTEAVATRLLEIRPELLDQHAFWERPRTSPSLLIGKAAAFGRPLQTVLARVRDKLANDSVTALLEGWPDEVELLVDELTKAPGDSRLVGAALGRSESMLQRAFESGVLLPPELLEEAAAQALQHSGFLFPPNELWRQLATSAGDGAHPNLMVLSFISAIGRGVAGRERIVRLFSPLKSLTARNGLPNEARRYLERAFQSLGIYRWSMSDALFEVLIATFLEGRLVAPEILEAVGQGEIDGLVEAVYARLGLHAVSDLKLRAKRGGNRFEAWKIHHLEDFVRRKEKRWFW